MALFEQYESMIRLSTFVAVFLIMGLAEVACPRRKTDINKTKRWFTNIALIFLGAVSLRLFIPVLAMEMAEIANTNQWGLLAWLNISPWIKVILAIIILDMLIYSQHVASQKIPILWRVHKMHHVDRHIDVTTGIRFHPIEIVISMAFKLACVIAIGAPVWSVFLFEILLNASAMFNHSNIKLPQQLDQALRFIIITSDMHRVHHSIDQKETDSNYGFGLSVWDTLFKTYQAQPKECHDKMTVGLSEHQDEKPNSLLWCLSLPFLSSKSKESN